MRAMPGCTKSNCRAAPVDGGMWFSPARNGGISTTNIIAFGAIFHYGSFALSPKREQEKGHLRKNILHHMPRHIGQPEVAAIIAMRETQMIEAEQMQDSGMH